MMNSRKRYCPALPFYDQMGLQKQLTKMAAQGWKIEKMGNFLYLYRRSAPQNLHFAITYFPHQSLFAPTPTADQQIFVDYCAKEGWQPVSQWRQMRIFCNDSHEPTPIETDAPTQVETIYPASRVVHCQPPSC